MIDIDQDIKDLLSDIAPLQLQFPNSKSTFPMISLSGINNQSNLILDSVERLSRVVLQLDIWDTAEANTIQRCKQKAADVNARMLSRGWKRDDGKAMEDPSGLHRYLMQFSGVIDNVTGAVYRNSKF